jgi:hypothetical protein
MNDKLTFWKTERDRIAAGIRHGSVEAHKGLELLAACDERICEHRDGIVPPDTEELSAEAAPGASNVTLLETVRAQCKAAVLARQKELRTRALAKYRADTKARTGRDPLDVAAGVSVATLSRGLSPPMMCAPWMLDLDETDGGHA